MGLIDFLKTTLVGAATGFVTGGPLGAVAGGAGAIAAGQLSQTAVGGPTQRGLTPTARPIQAALAATRANVGQIGGLADVTQAGLLIPGGLKNKVITRIQTLAPNGMLLREVVLDGRPFIMRKDFVILKRTLKLIAAAEKRVPRARRRGQQQRDELNELQGLVKGLIAAGDSTARALTVIDTGD